MNTMTHNENNTIPTTGDSVVLFNSGELDKLAEANWQDPDPNEFDLDLVKRAALLPDVNLQEHQQAVLNRFKDKEKGRMLLLHSLGSGKTLTSIGVAEQLNQPYTAVVPASLRNNMQKEMERFTDKQTPADVMSYSNLASGKEVPKTDTLIFDEAHRMRNTRSKQTIRAEELAAKAKRLILLSGTPVVNDPSDLASPLSLLTGQHFSPDDFRKRYVEEKEIRPTWLQRLRGVTPGTKEQLANKEELESLLSGHVDYYSPEKPTVPISHRDVTVEMGNEQSQLYKAMYNQLPWLLRWKLRWNFPLSTPELSHLTSFLSGPRQVGLSTMPFLRNKDPYKAYNQSPKLQKAMELLQEKLKDKRTKALIFSNYIDAGLRPYQAALERNKIPAGMFYGALSDEERRRLVDDYNNDKIRVALLGPSGTEGLSFKGTQLIQLLDPHWNAVRGRQSEGRGLRYDSHWGLPEDLQNVEVQRFIAKLPLGYRQRVMHKLLGRDYSNEQRAADDYLLNMSQRKENTNQEFIDLLKRVGSRHDEPAAGVLKRAAMYHGSDRPDLESLEPRPGYTVNKEPVVFGTSDRNLAISNIPKWRNQDFEQGYVNDQPHMREMYPGAFDKLIKGRKGTLYTMADEGFESDPRLMKEERISRKPVKPISREAIEDVLAELIKAKWELTKHDNTPYTGTPNTLPLPSTYNNASVDHAARIKSSSVIDGLGSGPEVLGAKPGSWVDYVMKNYTSTDPPPLIFTRTPQEIADAGDMEGVAPKGIGSWQRMTIFHKNRGGKRLTEERHKALQEAIQMLSQRIKERRQQPELYDPKTLLPIKRADFAPGLPSRQDYGDLSKLQVGKLYDYVQQLHDAHIAKRHTDLRFGSPETGLYSWAVRKGLPEPGKKHLAIQQPIHSHSYKDFEGVIPSGYGAGKVTKKDSGEVLITDVNDKSISFTTAHGRYPKRFMLLKPKTNEDKKWLLMNTTPTETIPYEKLHYKTLDPEHVDKVLHDLKPGSSVQAKLDGAASLTKLMTKHFDIASYRVSKETGGPIVHTERVMHGRPNVEVPPDLRNSVLRGELYGVNRGGEAIGPSVLGGLLNSSVGKSIRDQQSQGIDLKNLIFDIDRYGKKKIEHSTPYTERMELIKDILSRVNLPQDKFHLPEEAHTPEQAKALWNRVQTGQHPLTQEGIVVHPPTGKPTKVKIRPEWDVHIRNIFPGLGKYHGTGAGGFEYSLEPGGRVVGRAGTGLSDQLRRDMWSDPNAYIGRVARVKAHEQLPSGALRVPSFISLHEDYPTAPINKSASVIDGLQATPRPNIQVGEGSALSAEDIEGLLQRVEKNTNVQLNKVPIYANKSHFWRNLARYYFPSSLKHVPSRVGRALGTAVTPIVPGIGINTISNAIENARMSKGDFFLPAISTVNVGKGDPITLAHELGHYVDLEKGKGPYARNLIPFFQNKYKEQLTPTLNAELNASMFARKALGDAYTPEMNDRLSTALSSYLYAEQHNLNRRSFWEWLKNRKVENDKNWPTNLPQGLTSGDNQKRKDSLRAALNHVLRSRPATEGPYYDIPIAEQEGKLVWTDPKTKEIVNLAKTLLDTEYQRKVDHFPTLYTKTSSIQPNPIGSPLERLLAAKFESDRRNYQEKHRLLRDLILKHPDHFKIDSTLNGFVGITHVPTGFKIHLPQGSLPVKLDTIQTSPQISPDKITGVV